MKSIALSELVKAPAKVKKWTHAGQVVHVTENGAPLWVVTPDPEAVATTTRRLANGEASQVLKKAYSNLIKLEKHTILFF